MVPNDKSRRPQSIPPEPGKWGAFGLAVLMHVLLAIAFVFGLAWNNSSPGPVQAELWTSLPPPNRPDPDPDTKPVEPPPAPPEPVKPPPPPPPPETNVTPEKPDIAVEEEKKRREIEKQRAAEQEAADARKREQDKRDADKRLADKRAADQKEAEQREQDKLAADKARKAAADKVAADKAAADKLAADKAAAAEKVAADKKAAAEKKAADERDRKLREAFRGDTARAVAGLEGGRADGNANRNQAGGSGGDPGYGDLVRSCVKPGVIYAATGSAAGGNPTAVFRVQLLPTGEQAGPPRLQSSSGVPAFDRAVENGIRRCDPFPRPPSGRYESNITVQYRMFD